MMPLAIRMEPLRHLTAWWLRRGKEVQRGRLGNIPLLGMLLRATLPTLTSQRWLALLLQGQPRRLMLWDRRPPWMTVVVIVAHALMRAGWNNAVMP